MTEQEKYIHVYASDPYKIGAKRLAQTKIDILAIPSRGSFLDVGCGHRTLMAVAREAGFDPVKGVDFVPNLCDGNEVIYARATNLPFETGSFDVVGMFDVIEHLPPGEDVMAIEELCRVARKHMIISANNQPSMHLGMDLHINKRDYGEWEAMFQKYCNGTVVLLPGRHVSPMWRIDI